MNKHENFQNNLDYTFKFLAQASLGIMFVTVLCLLSMLYSKYADEPTKTEFVKFTSKSEGVATTSDISLAGADPCVAFYLKREIEARQALKKPLQLRDLALYQEVCQKAKVSDATMQEQRLAIGALK